MAKLAALILVLASTALSGGEVTIPFPSDSLIPSTGLNSFCTVRNEKVIGWFKGNVKIGVVPSRNDVKDKPAVVITAVNQFEKNVVLIFPKGTPVSAGGRYKCKGEQNEEFLDVKVRFNLDSLQRQQSLSLGKTEKIVLGADAYPFAKFKWKKDGVAIDFAANPRLTLKDDGSISIDSVRPSDAGRYDVNINWEKRAIVDETITVDVYGNPLIIYSPKNKTVTKGEQIRLICNATGHPTPNISWSKAGGTIKTGYVFGKMLVIPYATQSDAGKYICTAKNAYGGQAFMTNVEVFVTVKLRPHSPVPSSTQITDLSIKVHWKKPESHGYPVLMYSVHRVDLDEAGQEVTSRAYHVNEDVHQYEVGDIVRGKRYKFYVTAWNTHGESVKDHSKSITVNVQQP